MEVAVVYRFHIDLRDVSPTIWCRVELTTASSLADLLDGPGIDPEGKGRFQEPESIRENSSTQNCW
jgi:hypothetical protein